MDAITELFQRAVQCHQTGNLQQAEQLYRQILQVDPQHADAWHFLGLIAQKAGRYDLAMEYIGQALRLLPEYPVAHYNLGNVYKDRGRLDEAIASYEQAIRLKPDFVEALNNLGSILKDQGKLDDAITRFQQILLLNPDFFAAHNNLGFVFQTQGKREEAIACFRQALRLKPDYAEAHNNLGIALQAQGQGEEAVACYRQALLYQLDYFEAHNNLGIAFWRQGELEEALACFRQALLYESNYFEAHNNLGVALWQKGELEEALACFQQVLRLKPDHAAAHNNLGNAFRVQDRLDEALASFQEALRLKPDFAEAYNNIGNVLRDQGQLDEAVCSVREAIRLKPEYDEAHLNLGMLWLHQGNFEDGWVEYEWRQKVNKRAFRSLPQPRWDGHSLIGKTILLSGEQGLGDTLQFIRFAPLVKQKGGTVLFECPAKLARILRSCPGIDQILASGSPLPPFDVQAPLLSLPAILKTTLPTVPASIPYLSADPVLTERWRQELSNYPGFKIGIVWQGNPRFSQPECRIADQRRSIPLAHFGALAGLPGVRLFSLQKGYGTEQLAQWQERFGIIDLGLDFMETAAIMMNLDLIISADTSLVHLAGALGRTVWTVLPFAGDWRWLQDREDSPWYPTMRLFRQPKPSDWQTVFDQMADALGRMVSER